MVNAISPFVDPGACRQAVPAWPPSTAQGPAPVATGSYRLDASYHPQLRSPEAFSAGAQSGAPYAIPPGQTLASVAGGTRGQPFDVTLSQLATAVYGTRGDPPAGWSEVSDQALRERGVDEPQSWRLEVLGANDSVDGNAQEFRAAIYTDGSGNFVLAYRGTAEGAADWDNNFRQGLGYETRDGDKFSVTAANTAREFAEVFGNGNGGASSNLAITGHSQGGGLAAVGALASGAPAVTFDASGIHPNTLDRLGIAPQDARGLAEGGLIRAYSLRDDALTKAQDSWLTGLVAPDALGTQIVVDPASADERHMFTRYGPIEGFSPAQSAWMNAGVEFARNTPFMPLTPATGLVTGAASLGSDLAYSAISHSPNALTAGMVEHQPWQAGYENPTNPGRELQNLLPDAVKDDYARNVHDFARDVDAVVSGEFASGRHVQGAARLAGDLAEGAWNSAGDTIDGYADALAARIEAGIAGRAGSVLAGAVDRGGDAIEFVADAGGQVVESLANGAGWVAQGAGDAARGAVNLVGGLFGR